MSLVKEITTNPAHFDFIQVIRILRRSAYQGGLRFILEPLPAANRHPVQSVQLDSEQCQIRVAMTALAGAQSVLPDYFYQQLLLALHNENTALLDFVNIFNHRYFQLHLAQCERNNLLLRYEAEKHQGRNLTRFSQQRALSSISALPWQDKKLDGLLSYSILLGQKSRSLSGLKQLLENYFEIKVKVHTKLQSHHVLPTEILSKISALTGQNNQLGTGICLGKSCKLQAKSLEISLILDSAEQYNTFKNNTDFSQSVRKVVMLYLREHTPLKLFLQVKRKFISKPQLSTQSSLAMRLGGSNCLAPERKPEQQQNILLH